MTREELKNHCEKQIRACEMWAHSKGEEPHGKVYEEHKLILELLNQEPILNKIRTEMKKEIDRDDHADEYCDGYYDGLRNALAIIDKYKAESENKE